MGILDKYRSIFAQNSSVLMSFGQTSFFLSQIFLSKRLEKNGLKQIF